MKTRTKKRTLADVDNELRRLREAFQMALDWMGGSANAPLRRDEIDTILNLAYPPEKTSQKTKGPRA